MEEILSLSPQELKMLTALSFGCLYKEIANDYGISINTVKKHLKNVYKKLHVSKRTSAIQKFLEVAPKLTQQVASSRNVSKTEVIVKDL